MDAKTRGINPSIQYIKTGLDKWLTKGEEKRKTFIDYYDEFLAVKDVNQKKSTFKKYRTILKHLISFSKETKGLEKVL